MRGRVRVALDVVAEEESLLRVGAEVWSGLRVDCCGGAGSAGFRLKRAGPLGRRHDDGGVSPEAVGARYGCVVLRLLFLALSRVEAEGVAVAPGVDVVSVPVSSLFGCIYGGGRADSAEGLALALEQVLLWFW